MDYPHQPEHVTLVITHRLLAGKQPEYEQWLEKVMPQAALFDGHLGVNILRPVHGEQTYTVLIRFDTLDNLYRWINSTQRHALIAELPAMLCGPEHIELRPGAAFWFTPPTPERKAPKKWKQFLITLAVIYPSTNLVPWFWGTVLPAAKGTLWGHFLNDASVVALVVFLWMPVVTRLFANWLAPRGKSNLESNNE
ncbi:antibiotic biosynthesis monooxygenase [Pantoea coffeiphila]|uniref:antibiotic biosynthesis monooxygenase n=1 Tax=Pantoea coffeiphila TaxID=1465635 RepID=UPI001961CC2B|nr:antibiotic biosynthesis monooxygenase [Pantoea coffeiphila]MBM7345486.1 antibiotic biosynthesis monooxygenase (ABM) superfamily enzyme [Pantoea coffeiphila]